jgi:hypothetical protein
MTYQQPFPLWRSAGARIEQIQVELVLGLLRIVYSRSREVENRLHARQSVFQARRLLNLPLRHESA